MRLRLQPAVDADLAMVAALNRQLIDDEGHRNPMDLAELETRLRILVAAGWEVDLFVAETAVVGYALHRQTDDPLMPSGHLVELRQFFVVAHERRSGVGRQAIELLTARWPSGARVVVEVLEGNVGARAFWASVGFTAYARTLEQQLSS